MSSAVIYMGQSIPDKKLIKELLYKYYPSSEMKGLILKDLAQHTKEPLENFIIDVQINISLKEYDKTYQTPDKNQCYQEYLNTKTEG